MEIANVIVSGVRIYLPPDNVLPKPSTDMLTFAVVKDRDLSLTTCLWCTGMDTGNWPPQILQRNRTGHHGSCENR